MTYGVASPRDTRIHGFEEGGIMARLVMLHCIQPGGLKGLVIKPSRPAEPFVSGSPSLLTRKMPPPSRREGPRPIFRKPLLPQSEARRLPPVRPGAANPSINLELIAPQFLGPPPGRLSKWLGHSALFISLSFLFMAHFFAFSPILSASRSFSFSPDRRGHHEICRRFARSSAGEGSICFSMTLAASSAARVRTIHRACICRGARLISTERPRSAR